MLWYLLEASQMRGLPATYVFMEKYEKYYVDPTSYLDLWLVPAARVSLF